MENLPLRYLRTFLFALVVGLTSIYGAHPQSTGSTQPFSPNRTTFNQFVRRIQEKAKTLESTSGMRSGFQSFTSGHNLPGESVHYSDFVVVRLLFEATRDAGYWNLHWDITDQPPNSDRIWQQWKSATKPSPLVPTATAECDELSALYAFLAERAGVKSVGLFWPAANHTLAVWTVHPVAAPVIRVVVPTSQIFLDENDRFDTKKFDPWHQKTIYEYTRRDVPDSFEIPAPLVDFFLEQTDNYGGASDDTLQRLRYLREGVFLKQWTAEYAAREAVARRDLLKNPSAEDIAALQNFAQDMRTRMPK
ncbi:MAG TPA: hypothetical protein VIW93_02050 [Candidatus Acidoferrum sp.]